MFVYELKRNKKQKQKYLSLSLYIYISCCYWAGGFSIDCLLIAQRLAHDLNSMRNMLSTIDRCWTSCWSPIGSRSELRTTNDQFLKWFCIPRLFYVFTNK